MNFKPMNILSLFDGMSCGQLALNRAKVDYDNYYASEVDPYAIKIAMKNFPGTKQIGDVSLVDTKQLPKIDLLIGGSPCQSFTFAGKRAGMATKDKIDIISLNQYLELKEQGFEFEGQSYLFWEYVRIWKELKPKYFLLENVKMEEKWKHLISKVLNVSPVFINSNVLSAQNRQRLYWTNIPFDLNFKPNKETLKDIIVKESEVDEKFHLSSVHHKAFLKSYKWKHNEITEKSKPLLASYYKQPPHCPYIKCKKSESGFRRLLPVECERLQTIPDGYTEGVSDTQRYKMIGNGWTIDVIAQILKGIKNAENN